MRLINKSFAFISAAFLVAAFACKKQEPQQTEEEGIVFSASFDESEDDGEDDKTSLTSANKVNWVKGDPITVFWGTGSSDKGTATASASGSSAQFKVSGAPQKDNYYAVYPSSAVSSLKLTDTYDMTVNVPKTQHGVFSEVNIAVAKTSATAGSFKFKNLCCLIKVNISRNDIAEVRFRGFNDETVVGEGFQIKFNSGIPSIVGASKSQKEAVLTPSNSASSFTPGTYYWAVLPGNFSKGFKITAKTVLGAALDVKQTTANVTLTRSYIVNVGYVDSENGQGIIPPVLPTGKTLYNGITLPSTWPPTNYSYNNQNVMDCPYLTTDHPAVVPIDVGRQLFVDDFLIGSKTSGVSRVYYQPTKYSGNPVLPITNSMEDGTTGSFAGAGPKDGGVWWNPVLNKFQMWYEAGWLKEMAYAESTDGLNWEKPAIKSGTDLNMLQGMKSKYSDQKPNSCSVIIDYDAKDGKIYKMFLRQPDAKAEIIGHVGHMYSSTDGKIWTWEKNTGKLSDRSVMFYNPFRKKWVFSIRGHNNSLTWESGIRDRFYYECDNPLTDCDWTDSDKGKKVVFWCRADVEDAQDPDIKINPQLYNLDAVAYESIMLGMHEILVDENDKCQAAGRPKITNLEVSFSRDGFHFSRPVRTYTGIKKAFIKSEKKDGIWDRGYVQPCGGICSVYGEKLVFWYIGFAGDSSRAGESACMHSNMRTGVAILRRDGFCSMKGTGTLTTVPIKFNHGKYLYVNAKCSSSATLRAEILDEKGNVISGYEKAHCTPFSKDSTIGRMTFKDDNDKTVTLDALDGRTIKIKFYLEGDGSTELYAFWVSQASDGRSYGFVAGGGPGYTSNVDNVGNKATDAGKALFPFK